MKNKILKIATIILLIMTLTLTNFLFVGSSLISYAASGLETNNKNIDFEAYFINDNDEKISSIDMSNLDNIYLYIQIQVKQEGYFNGKVIIEDSNFSLRDTDSSYVNKIDGNTITLNQINANTKAEAKIGIELNKDEVFNLDDLNKKNVISLEGTYFDSSERDKEIKASRELELELIENNSKDNLSEDVQLITNKITEIDGQEKRVIQLLWNVGLKDNNYPIKEIEARVNVPSIDGKRPEVVKVVDFNTMTYYDYSYDGSNVVFKFTNKPNDNNEIRWKDDGQEKIVLSFIYDKDVVINSQKFVTEQKIKLYDEKELANSQEINLDNTEKDNIVSISSYAEEDGLYKGRLYAGLEQEYVTNTKIDINLAKAINNIEIEENANQSTVKDSYTKIVVQKEEFDELFGEKGEIDIYNQNNEQIGKITSTTEVDSDKNIVISFNGDVTAIRFETSSPIAEGTLNIKNYKKLLSNVATSDVQGLSQVGYISKISYNDQELEQVENNITLKETITQSKFEVNKDTLSTVVDNSVEIRATLLTNNEQYDLYQNPVFTFELPEQVQSVDIRSVDLLYENELKIANYNVDGRNIVVTLTGKQTDYKDIAVEGAVLVINADLTLDKKAASISSNITMYYQNENAHQYDGEEARGIQKQEIRIVAPKDVTVINSIPTISLETTGQDESTSVNLIRQNVSKQLEVRSEVINTNENIVEDVKILGSFPTNSQTNNLGIQLINAIQVSDRTDVTIYYTENESATNDISNQENAWTTDFVQNARKYLIIVEQLETGASIEFSYLIQIPEQLEYNKQAKEYYCVNYIDRETSVQSNIDSSVITLETGIGQKLEAKLSAKVAGNEITQNVKNGEVIQYNIEVSNTGSEEINNIEVIGQVPEGTTMVIPEENYEYTGASYYEELPDKEYKTTIENIGVGDVKTITYEVRVNNDTLEGTRLENKLKVIYGEVTAETENHTLVTEKGNLRVTVKRVTDRKIDLYTSGTVQYFAIIENISDESLKDVKINTHISDNLEVNRLSLITGMGKEDGNVYGTDSDQVITEAELENENTSSEDIQSEIIEYKDEISIGELTKGQVKVLSYDMTIKDSDKNNIEFWVSANDGQKDYNSNSWKDNVEDFNIELNMTTQTESQYIKSGDLLEYTINIKNLSNSVTSGLVIKDDIPSQLDIENITLNGDEITGVTTNSLEIPVEIEANSEAVIVIQTVVNYSEGRLHAEAITNVAYAEVYGERVAATQEINHIIQANDGSTSDGNNDIEDNDIAKGTRTITGVAWFDENSNGIRDNGEETLSGVKVKLLNAETNNLVKDTDGNVLEVTTNENGIYVLDKIGNGKYIAIFDYDKTKYTLTRYKVSGVAEDSNSDVLMNNLKIENIEQEVPSTDILEVNDSNISDVNIGLALLQNYDLKLDKYVSKIILQNNNGTTVKEYQDETLAKAEIDAKQINGTTAIIEYQIKVTNLGDITGYVRKIADYIPNDLTFNSEMNKDWYQSGNEICTSVLSNEPIAAGETKTVTLTLVKTMNENNTGRINNRAEIVEDYNDLGIKDVNSTPGNQEAGENDIGSADAILSVRTGGVVYVSVVIVLIVILSAIGIIIYRKNKKGKM